MCGIVGIVSNNNNNNDLPKLLRQSLSHIQHRGYDGAGLAVAQENVLNSSWRSWTTRPEPVALITLSILMFSDSNIYTLDESGSWEHFFLFCSCLNGLFKMDFDTKDTLVFQIVLGNQNELHVNTEGF